MNAILGMTELAKTAESRAERLEDIDQIATSCNYLLGLVNDILDVSKMSSEKLELHYDWCNAEELFRSITVMVKPLMEKNNLNFEYPDTENAHFKNVEMYIDEMRVRQVYINILSNAAKFTPPGGTITLRAKNISRSDEEIEDEITITDTGCGMTEEFISHIGESFIQEKNAYSDKERGTGLGLYIVKKIIDAAGGTLTVKSKLGKGSSFTFTMLYKYRIVEAQKEQDETSRGETVVLNGMHVLLVEDNALNQTIARRLLEKQGVIVDAADNGKLGVELFEKSTEHFYDVILMDIRMPVMGGIEAAEHIRNLQRPDAKTVSIVAVTADAFAEDVQKTKQAGMNAHLSKPIVAKELYETLYSIWNNGE